MSTFKGFGTPGASPRDALIGLEANTREEMDRAMRSYLSQGLSVERALNRVAASVMCLAAAADGMEEGVDYLWSDKKGMYMSSRMVQWAKGFTSKQTWNHLEMEGFITAAEPEPEPEEP